MIKAENIATKEFRRSLYGYDCEEVDRYLDELIAQLKQMEQERLEMATTIEYLSAQLAPDPLADVMDIIVGPVSPGSFYGTTGRHRLAASNGDET